MNTGLLHLHNALRWVILIALVFAIVKLLLKKDALKTSKVLLISAHTTLLLGLYQYFFGPVGFFFIKNMGMAAAMKDKLTRFWAVEHILTMIIAIALITIGHVKYKKGGSPRNTLILYILALLLIFGAIPWPFRTDIARPLFPGMGM
jgi:K+-sensing histidine kinase KdpD